MEIVGGIVSITQLSRYALSLITTISGIYRNVQGGSVLQHQRLRQLERLFCTVQTLNESSVLNKASIKEHLTAIIERIQDLRVLLERLAAQQTGPAIKKYLKAFIKGNRGQNRILEVFIDLEQEKAALLLSIAETHTEVSARIYDELFERLPPCTQGNPPSENVYVDLLESLATQTEMTLEQKKASAKDKGAKKSLAMVSVNDSSIARIPGSQDRSVEGRHSRANEGRPDERQETPLAGQYKPPPAQRLEGHADRRIGGPTAVANAEKDLPNANDASRKMTGHIYESITFLGRADIHAGDIGESKSGDERSQKHRYQKIEAKEGRAICGDAYCDGYLDKFFEEKK